MFTNAAWVVDSVNTDCGSRQWLLKYAIQREESTGPGTSSESNQSSAPSAAASKSATTPTTTEQPVEEDEELPEDKFHKADLLSQHYISQVCTSAAWLRLAIA